MVGEAKAIVLLTYVTQDRDRHRHHHKKYIVTPSGMAIGSMICHLLSSNLAANGR